MCVINSILESPPCVGVAQDHADLPVIAVFGRTGRAGHVKHRPLHLDTVNKYFLREHVNIFASLLTRW